MRDKTTSNHRIKLRHRVDSGCLLDLGRISICNALLFIYTQEIFRRYDLHNYAGVVNVDDLPEVSSEGWVCCELRSFIYLASFADIVSLLKFLVEMAAKIHCPRKTAFSVWCILFLLTTLFEGNTSSGTEVWNIDVFFRAQQSDMLHQSNPVLDPALSKDEIDDDGFTQVMSRRSKKTKQEQIRKKDVSGCTRWLSSDFLKKFKFDW